MNRSLKRLLVKACDPLDAVARRINGKRQYPPLHLRWEVGPLRGFETSASEYRVFLRIFGGLTAKSSVLDIGCGCGQTALWLTDDLGPEGYYEGWDIFKPSIEWCQRHLTARDRRFVFRHLDAANGMYNPAGKIPASSITLPADRKFDVILLKSVFTHMLPQEVENYVHQLRGLLAPGGRCLASFFLLNKNQRRLAAEQKNRIRFEPHPSGAFVADPRVPEAITAYEEEYVLSLAYRWNLRLAQPALYGSWTGDPAGLTHQDLLIFEACP